MRKQRAVHLEASKNAASSGAAPRKATRKELLDKRAAILDERADTKLERKDKAIFQYKTRSKTDILTCMMRPFSFFHVGQCFTTEDA